MSPKPAAIAAGITIATTGARLGIKGSDAPALLQLLGLPVPAQPNRFTQWSVSGRFGSGRCLRQGNTEFLVELDAASAAAIQTSTALPNAWLLIRSDHSLVLRGDHWPRALSQLCSFDFTRLDDEPDLVVMTLLAGIGVTLIREPASIAGQDLRLWCDPSYASYLQQCLHSIGGSR